MEPVPDVWIDPCLRVVGREYHEIDEWLYCQLIYEES